MLTIIEARAQKCQKGLDEPSLSATVPSDRPAPDETVIVTYMFEKREYTMRALRDSKRVQSWEIRFTKTKAIRQVECGADRGIRWTHTLLWWCLDLFSKEKIVTMTVQYQN